jgi:Xaa-Pro aminopeptidase
VRLLTEWLADRVQTTANFAATINPPKTRHHNRPPPSALRYQPTPSDFFIENRRRLAALLPPGALVILHANDLMPTNADGTLGFAQNSDLFYLSGIDQEETVLMLFPDAPDPKHREVLLVRETTEQISIWEGEKLTQAQARERSGIEKVVWTSEFEALFRLFMCQAAVVFLNGNEHPRATIPVVSRELRFARRCRHEYPLHRIERLSPLLYPLRGIKSSHEIALIQEACRITRDGFLRLLKFVRPGVHEFEIEAELAHEYLRQRAGGFAYPPIIASGLSACCLHYNTNHGRCEDGQILLIDAAAKYANYNADLTRSIPVNGRFTDRQREVYEAVLGVFRASCDLLRPGVLIREYQEKVAETMTEALIGLRLLDPKAVAHQDPEKPLYKKYFMHGTSHHLGLDVHDVPPSWHPIQPGMVFTVEPGIYIREEGFGIRLENDILIGGTGNTDLMADIPIEVDEIEALMPQNQ